MREPFFTLRKANLLERITLFLGTRNPLHFPLRCYDRSRSHPYELRDLFTLEPTYQMSVEGRPERFGFYAVEKKAEFACKSCGYREIRRYGRLKILEPESSQKSIRDFSLA